MRIITNAAPVEHAKPVFKKPGILTLIDTYILESALIVRKITRIYSVIIVLNTRIVPKIGVTWSLCKLRKHL